MKRFYILFFVAGISLSASAQLEYKDVAGIFYSRCTSCHHENQHAPSFMKYSEIYPLSSFILADLQSGKMPPWSPDTTYTHFFHERFISPSEKSKIIDWINSGSIVGDTTLAPPAPGYSKYKLNGKPDLVLQIPTFTSNGGTSDVYNCFALPTGLSSDRIIRAFEVVPGNPAIVHHIVIKVDTTGTANSDLSGGCHNQPGDFDLDVWAPGGAPTIFPSSPQLKCGITLKKGWKIIMQIHYPAGTAGQLDSTQIRLYFYPVSATGIRPVYVFTPLVSWNLPILAKTTPTFTAQYPSSGTLPAALSILSTFPHSHFLCKTMLNYADNGTTTIPLIRINNWDFNWQGFYTFPKMVKVPAGYTLRASHMYDNTTNNPNNPNNPPQMVNAGFSTTDEMLFDSFKYLIYQAGDETIDISDILEHDSLINNTTFVNEIVVNQITSYAFPNPFSESTTLVITSGSAAHCKLKFFDIYGKEVFADIKRNADSFIIQRGNLPSGVYFYSLSAGKYSGSGKLILTPNK